MRTLEHLDLLSSRFPPPGPYPAWFVNGAFGVGEEALASQGVSYECSVGLSRLSVSLELPADAEIEPTPPVCLVVPCPSGLASGTLHALRGGPRHFVAGPPARWTWSNRRTAYRVPLHQAGRAEKDGEALDALLLDVSIGGGRVRLPLGDEELEPGTHVRVNLPLAGDPWVDAEVVRVHEGCESGCTCGVRWLDLPVSVDQRLANFVFSAERAVLAKKR